MKKIVIADITSLTYKNGIYGHFLKVAQQYKELFKDEKDVRCYIYGGKTYKNYVRDSEYIKAPFLIKNGEMNKSRIRKTMCKIKEIINSIYIINTDADIIIFQCYSEIPVFISLLFQKNKSKKIFMIQYQKGLTSRYSRKIFNRISKKITGIITSTKEVGEYYGINYIVAPDYFPGEENKENHNIIYDFVVLGTVSEWKDYEDVIETFINTDFKVKIAGKFFDEKRLKKLKCKATSNIEIEDKYLTDEEYDYYISRSKYVILPYRRQYEEKSSGIVLDSIYRGTPVIASDLKSFQFIKDNEIGLLYKNSIKELMNELNDLYYDKYKENTKYFIMNKRNEMKKLINFIKN